MIVSLYSLPFFSTLGSARSMSSTLSLAMSGKKALIIVSAWVTSLDLTPVRHSGR